MKKTLRRAGAVAAAAAFSGALMMPMPAQAATCSGFLGSNPITIGLLGDDVTSTPEAHIEVCVGGDIGTSGVPMVRVETCCPSTTRQTVWLDWGSSTGEPIFLSVRYSIGGSGSTTTVPVPVPTGGGSTCIFYRGSASSNPGDCLAYVET